MAHLAHALMSFRRITQRARLKPPYFCNWRIPAASSAAPRRPARERLPPEIPGNGKFGVRTAGFRGTRRIGGAAGSSLLKNRLVPACWKTGTDHTETAPSASSAASAAMQPSIRGRPRTSKRPKPPQTARETQGPTGMPAPPPTSGARKWKVIRSWRRQNSRLHDDCSGSI